MTSSRQRRGFAIGAVGLGALICLEMTFGCKSYVIPPTPQTDGFHLMLPSPYTRAVVWGSRSNAVQNVTTWLLKRGYTIVDQTKLLQVAGEQRIVMTSYQYQDSDVLRIGRLVGARQVIFVDTDIASMEVTVFDGGLPEKQTVHSGSMTIRAVDVETGEIHWSGKARYGERFPHLDEGLNRLACHALATAWGLRPPGAASRDGICAEGQSNMVHTVSPPKSPQGMPTTQAIGQAELQSTENHR
ncbi:MAG: hypothetical protein ACT4OO_12090 [Nitrospiraceae bacterium]